MLEEIAAAILDHVQVHIEDLENEWLEITFNHLKKNKKLGQLRDAMKFLNYNRDYSCTVPQFVSLFRENFAMKEGILEDYQIKMIMQRYAVNTEQATVSAGAVVKNRDAKFSKNQRIFYLQMIIDFENRNHGISFDQLFQVPIVEKLMKLFELFYPDKGSFPRHIKFYSRGSSNIDEN